MKMIPDEVGMVGLALLGLRIGVEVGDGNRLVSSFHSGTYFFFSGLYAVCSLLYLLITHTSSFPLK